MSIYNYGSNSAYSPYTSSAYSPYTTTSGLGTNGAYSPYTSSAYSPYTTTSGLGTNGAYSPYTTTSGLGTSNAYSPYGLTPGYGTSSTYSPYGTSSGSGSSSGFSAANLANLFQESYQNALNGTNALGISSSSLINEALGGATVAGSNPLDPLQGQPALQGLDSFVNGIQQSYSQNVAAGTPGYTPATASGVPTTGTDTSGSTMDPSSMLSALSSMMGMLGGSGSSSGLGSSSLLNGFSPSTTSSADDLSGLGGSPTTASAYDVSADQSGSGSGSSSNLLGELQSMLSMLTSLMGSMGGGSGTGTGTPSLTSPYGTSNAYSPYGATPTPTSAYSPYGTTTGTGSSPLDSTSLFTQGVNMNLIDSAINQTLGSISNTLPMVNL
jgi:hypothetical protein